MTNPKKLTQICFYWDNEGKSQKTINLKDFPLTTAAQEWIRDALWADRQEFLKNRINQLQTTISGYVETMNALKAELDNGNR